MKIEFWSVLHLNYSKINVTETKARSTVGIFSFELRIFLSPTMRPHTWHKRPHTSRIQEMALHFLIPNVIRVWSIELDARGKSQYLHLQPPHTLHVLTSRKKTRICVNLCEVCYGLKILILQINKIHIEGNTHECPRSLCQHIHSVLQRSVCRHAWHIWN
jgi:hypothetical protein